MMDKEGWRWCGGGGGGGVTVWRMYVMVLLHLCCMWAWIGGTADTDGNVQVYSGPFEDVEHIRVLVCTSDTSDTDISVIKLIDARNSTALVYISLRSLQCRASSPYFSSCDLHPGQQKVTLKAIINDLEEGEVRLYGCEVLRVVTEAVSTFYYVNVSYVAPTTTTTLEPASTEDSTGKTGSAVGSSQTSTEEGFHLPNSVVFVILGLLVLFITLCCVLGIHYYRGRRRKRKSGDCDAMSMRSGVTDKDFYTVGLSLSPAVGGGGGRLLRPIHNTPPSSYSPPSTMAPQPPGSNRVVMQYQKPSDSVADAGFLTFSDRGYVSGSSVHYQEPWGRQLEDPEILGKLSTLRSQNRSLVKIPDFDATLTLPRNPATAPPPTQETAEQPPSPPSPPDLTA